VTAISRSQLPNVTIAQAQWTTAAGGTGTPRQPVATPQAADARYTSSFEASSTQRTASAQEGTQDKGDTSNANIDKMLRSSYSDFFPTPIGASQYNELMALGQKLRGEGKSEREIKDAIINKIVEWKTGTTGGSGGTEGKGDTSNANIDRMLRSSYSDFFPTPIGVSQYNELMALGQKLRGEGKSEREIRDAIINKIVDWKLKG
jgi:uncharacterized membrane protein